jgi:transporter family protein
MSSTYLILFSIFGWGIGSLFYKTANDNAHPIMVSTIVTAVYIVLTPIPFFFMKFDHSVNSTGLIYSILGGLCMCVGSMGYFYALRQGSAGSITVLTSLYPAVTLLLSMIFMGETINFKQGIGCALALIAFVLLGSK